LFLPFTVTLIGVLLLLIAGTFFAFEAVISASITITPQVHPVNSVFTVTAKPNLPTSDVRTASVPAGAFTSTKMGSQQGTTSQQCDFGIFECRQVVSFTDVQDLAAQIEPTVQTQITQDIQQQVQAAGATIVGDIHYNDPIISANPPVGSVSNTVTVTVTQQGSVEYFKGSDVQSLAGQLLQQQLKQQYGSNYILLSSSTQIGQPAIEGVDADGVVTLQIAAASVAEYQFPANELRDIQNLIKGKQLKDALTLLKHQRGVDANSVMIRINYGDTLPNNVQQIKIVHVEPTQLPPVQLPTVQPTLTPTLTTPSGG
jgi:hypothetical protein